MYKSYRFFSKMQKSPKLTCFLTGFFATYFCALEFANAFLYVVFFCLETSIFLPLKSFPYNFLWHQLIFPTMFFLPPLFLLYSNFRLRFFALSFFLHIRFFGISGLFAPFAVHQRGQKNPISTVQNWFKQYYARLTEDCSYVTVVTSREQAFFVSIFDEF